MATSRTHDDPCYVLHRHDWSESSLILEVLSRQHGRIALVAKGAKRPSSNFRPVLLPLQPLRLNHGGDAEIRTLKSAEWVGGHVMPTGEALLSGFYVNELLLRLLPRDDPHPVLFDAYAAVVRWLAGGDTVAASAAALRAFELLLLREVGVLPQLDVQTLTLTPLAPDAPYVLVPEGGLRAAHADDGGALTGAVWQALQTALNVTDAPIHALVAACAPHASALRVPLRRLLHYHCGVGSLRTRQMVVDLQAL